MRAALPAHDELLCTAIEGHGGYVFSHTRDGVVAAAAPPAKGLRDKVLHVDTVFSLGLWKPFPKFRFGSSDKAFGTPGAGGSFGMADQDIRVPQNFVLEMARRYDRHR
jgi:hypothetical protein